MTKSCLVALLLFGVLLCLFIESMPRSLLVLLAVWLIIVAISHLGGKKQAKRQRWLGQSTANFHGVPDSPAHPIRSNVCPCGNIVEDGILCDSCTAKLRQQQEEEKREPCSNCGRVGYQKLYNNTMCFYCDDSDDD